MLRRFHDVWYQGIWCAIACIAVVCAAASLDVFAMSNLREQCFANKEPAAQEAWRSYVEESRFKLSDIISLGRELETKFLFRTPSLFTSRDFGLIQKERNFYNNCKWRKASKTKPQGKILPPILAPEPSVLPIFNVRSSREPRRSRRVNAQQRSIRTMPLSMSGSVMC